MGGRQKVSQHLFEGPPPEEVRLARAPLARVIGQVRFPPNLALARPDEVAGFQKAIRRTYPVLSRMDMPAVAINAIGEMKVTPETVWKFSDAENQWGVAVSTTFVALETRSYVDRSDFLARLATVLEAADAEFSPQVATRLGLRYVNRIIGPALDRLPALVRPEMQGMTSPPLGGMVKLTMTESQLELPEKAGRLALRHGLMPAQATYDPVSLEPLPMPSWILDIDASKESPMTFDPTALSELSRQLADWSYRLFRWVVTEQFLREHGA
jgi:uncharacterized protein (TIGR04255 family)